MSQIYKTCMNQTSICDFYTTHIVCKFVGNARFLP